MGRPKPFSIYNNDDKDNPEDEYEEEDDIIEDEFEHVDDRSEDDD